MSPAAIAVAVFTCASIAAIAGMMLHIRLPGDHLDSGSRDVMKLVMGLIATMAALVLSLLIASANSAYDAQASELKSLSANIILLDRTLALLGPQADVTRAELRKAVVVTHDQIWPPDRVSGAELDPSVTRSSSTAFVERLQALSPRTEGEKSLQGQALQMATAIASTRLLMFEQLGVTIAWPFLTVLVSWICVLFLGFGLLARFHATVAATLQVGALSVAGAICLILELNHPYSGLMQISDAPLRGVLGQIGQ